MCVASLLLPIACLGFYETTFLYTSHEMHTEAGASVTVPALSHTDWTRGNNIGAMFIHSLFLVAAACILVLLAGSTHGQEQPQHQHQERRKRPFSRLQSTTIGAPADTEETAAAGTATGANAVPEDEAAALKKGMAFMLDNWHLIMVPVSSYIKHRCIHTNMHI